MLCNGRHFLPMHNQTRLAPFVAQAQPSLLRGTMVRLQSTRISIRGRGTPQSRGTGRHPDLEILLALFLIWENQIRYRSRVRYPFRQRTNGQCLSIRASRRSDVHPYDQADQRTIDGRTYCWSSGGFRVSMRNFRLRSGLSRPSGTKFQASDDKLPSCSWITAGGVFYTSQVCTNTTSPLSSPPSSLSSSQTAPFSLPETFSCGRS